jgi:TolA-binding protein
MRRSLLRLEDFYLRMRHLILLATLAACASAPVRPSASEEELRELRSQLLAQSALVAQQQRRIEDLEVKLAALAAKAQPASAAQPSPAKSEPRPQLKTVKLGEGRRLRRDRVNPVALAPRLPATVQLKEPDEDALSRLETDPQVAEEFDADQAWAAAVQKLNAGKQAEAEIDFLAFVAAHPRHAAADNALYLAGLVREVRGDCEAALQLLEAVPLRYPAGDAVVQAMLERGRCLRMLGRKEEARRVLSQLDKEHPDAPEAAAGRMLLQGL